MFTGPDTPRAGYPKLRGKGAEIKYLVSPLLQCWQAFHVDIDYEFETVRVMLERQIALQDILSDNSTECFLPVAAAQALMDHCDAILHCYTLLANKADREKVAQGLLWNINPQFHWLWHWAQRSVYLNPRKSNCFIDEDFVGDIKEVVAASCAGTSMECVHAKLMEKIVWQMHFANAS